MRKFYAALFSLCALTLGTSLSSTAQSTCSTPKFLNNDSLPYNSPVIGSGVEWTTCGQGTDYTSADPGACANSNEDAEDYVISFSPTADVCVDIDLTYDATGVSLFVYKGCPDDAQTTCIDKDTGGNPRQLAGITMLKDTNYFIVISDNLDCAIFEIAIAENPGALGDHCCNPYPLTRDSLDFNSSWDTDTLTDNYDQGSVGMNGPESSTTYSYAQDNDIIFTYTTDSTDCITIDIPDMTADPGLDPGIYILNGCPDSPSSSVLAWARTVNGSTETAGVSLTHTVTAGTYYIYVGTKGSPNGTQFDVDITLNSAPGTGAQCSAPVVIAPASLPYNAAGETTLCHGTFYDSGDACGSDGLNGEEKVYTFTPTATQCYDLSISNADDGAYLFVFDNCPNVLGTSCLIEEPEAAGTASAFGLTLTSGTTYYIVVSSDPDDNASVNFDLDLAVSGGATTGYTCCAPTVIGAMPFSASSQTTCATGNDYENKCNNTYMDAEDYIYTYTSPGNECLTITIPDGSVTADADVAAFVLDGCPNDGAANCLNYATVDNGASDQFGFTFSAGLATAGTYYIVIDGSDADVACSTFDVNMSVSGLTTGLVCSNAMDITSVHPSIVDSTYRDTNTTCCYGNDYTSADACGSNYMDGDDYVYTYTPPSDVCMTITIEDGSVNLGEDPGLFILDACPDNLAANCVAFGTRSNTSGEDNGVSAGAVLTGGTTYYIVVSTNGANTCTSYILQMAGTSTAGATGSTCSNPESISTYPYTAIGESTRCMADDYDNTSTSSCGSLYESGEDKVYEIVKVDNTAQCLTLTLSNTSTNSIGYQLYDGCPDAGGTTCLASVGGASSGTLSGSIILPGAGTYYLIVDTWANPSNVDYDISVVNNGSAQTNDLPCDATALALGTSTFGDNTCSGDASEVAAPGCWDSGNYNTVWFSAVAPASGELSVKTNAGSLTDTQIGLYSGACGALTLVSCNDDYTSCGNSLNTSEIVATGLTPGNTYYIRVDGAGDSEGNFTIVAIDGTSTYPSYGGQDCDDVEPLPACNEQVVVGNPGYSGTGNNCDFNGTNNCTSGEKASVWYSITIDASSPASSPLNIDIIPNDGTPTGCGTETDYDFLVWRTAGTGTTTNCAGIAANPGTGLVACNFSWLGVTGVGAGGNAPAPYNSCYNPAYEPSITTQPGDEYYVVVQNWTSNSQGFQVNFSNTTGGVIDFVTPSSLVWSGQTDTDVTDSTNWGGCIIPACDVDVTIAAGPANQPVVAAGDTLKVGDLVINSGASLQLGAASVLQVCGDYTNLGGTITCDPTSVFLVDSGSTTQNLAGSMTGADAFGIVKIEKTGGGQVNLNNNLDCQGDLEISSTSVVNVNGKYVKVGGDFSNANGNTSWDRGAFNTDVLEFNGSGAQQYIPGGALGLNSIVLNNTGSGVTLIGANMFTGLYGTVSLYNGTLNTGAVRVLVVNNEDVNAITTGNTGSYINGRLRLEIDADLSTNSLPMTYNFPVGDATGFQRCEIEFINATSITDLQCEFDTYTPTILNWGSNDCSGSLAAPAYDANSLDNGLWDFSIIGGSTSATEYYTAKLYPTNYSNGAAGFVTVMIDHELGSGWELQGACDPASALGSTVLRDSLAEFSKLAVAQHSLPLPVDLIYFDGHREGTSNVLNWVTLSEQNNDYFMLERSKDGKEFDAIGEIDGAGTTSDRNEYEFIDFDPPTGINYYRLKQVDFDGSTEYSRVIALKNGPEAVDEMVQMVYPNPTRDALMIDLQTKVRSDYEFVVSDNYGNVVAQTRATLDPGYDTYRINELIGLAQGIYFIKITNKTTGVTYVEKVTKL